MINENNYMPHEPRGREFDCLMYDDFGLDYAESLTEGDLRPYVIENYSEESGETQNELF